MNTRKSKPYTLDRVVRIIITLLLVVCIGMLINRLSEALLPFLIAWLLAYLLFPLMQFFQNKLRLKSRILAIAATLLTFFGLFSLAGYLFIPSIIDQTLRASKLIGEFLASPDNGLALPPKLMLVAQDLLSKLDVQNYINFNTVEGFIKSILPKIWDLVSGASGLILNIFIVFIVFLYLVFILLDYEKISTDWVHLIPKNYRPFVLQMGDDLKRGMNQYFRGQALISLIVGIGYAIGFSIIGLPMGIIFGLSVGVMHMVPYLQTVSLIPAVMLCAIKSAEYNQAFSLVLASMFSVYVVMQIIIELILTPKIMGRVMSMHPALILLSLSIWGSLMGILGMIIALPITTILISYYKRFIIEREFIEDLVSPNWNASNSEPDEAHEAVQDDASLNLNKSDGDDLLES